MSWKTQILNLESTIYSSGWTLSSDTSLKNDEYLLAWGPGQVSWQKCSVNAYSWQMIMRQGTCWTNKWVEQIMAKAVHLSSIVKVEPGQVDTVSWILPFQTSSMQGLPRWFCFERCLVDIEEDRQGLGTGPCFYHGCCVRQPAHDFYWVGQTTEMIAMTATRRMMRMMRMMRNGVWVLLSPKCYSSFCWHILGSHCP